jgi:steroid delta-isomerase-like uncharacterized protein
MSEQNKYLVRRAVEEIWNQQKYALLDEMVATDFVIHGGASSADIHGAEGARQFFTMLHRAFPDIHFTIDEQVAEGDRVVTHWTARGTHEGDFRGLPATGNRFKITAIDIDRIVDGKVVECWTNMDELGLLQQLGVVPQLEG